MKKNKLSILMPSNRKWFKSLSGILKAFEIEDNNVEVIIADNSGDSLKKSIISQLFEDRRNFNAKLIKNQENTSLQKNWRSAIIEATGSHILFLADDDYFNTEFIDEFLEKNRDNTKKYYIPPLHQYGFGRISSIFTTELSGINWGERIISHINARITPLLIYSITPADLAKKFFLSYIKNHPLVGTFLDWSFEYFIRAWCEGENLTKGFYLWDGERWMQAQTAMDADAKQYMQYGLPYWFVAFHQLFWAVDLCHFIDSAYFPKDKERRNSVIRAIINRNMPIMRNELASVKNHLFQNAALPQSLKKDIIALVQDGNPDLEDLDVVFFRILEETLPSKAYEYRGFIEKIKTEEIYSLNLEGNGKNCDEILNVDSNVQSKSSFVTPKVSVIIPCYNQAQFLEDSVSSVLAQSFEDWECIIVNDGSPDDTSAVARALLRKDPKARIRLLEKENGGLASARNFGIVSARGRYILPLDADDKIDSNFLKETVAILDNNPEFSIVYTDEQNFGEANHIHVKGESRLDVLKLANVHDYCSLYRKEVWEKVGGYSPAMYLGGEDWNFWVAAAKNGFKSFHLQKPLFFYRNRPNTMVSGTLASLDEVWAHMVFHHPEIYTKEEIEKAKNILANTKPENIEKLKIALKKHHDNKILQKIAEAVFGRKNNPLVSVIIPTYNRPDLLIRAIRSVKEQNYKNTEIIVVNDAGKEVSDIVNWLSEGSNIVYVRHGINRRQAATRNTGLRVARGEIICYLDDDDVFLPDHIETIVDHLTESDSPFAYTEAEYVVESSEHSQMKELRRYRYSEDMSFSRKRLHVCNYIPVNTWAHRRRILDEVGYFDETLDNHEDWEFLLRCARKFDLVHVPRVTVEVHQRLEDDNTQRRERSKFFETFQLIYSRYDDLGDPLCQNSCRLDRS